VGRVAPLDEKEETEADSARADPAQWAGATVTGDRDATGAHDGLRKGDGVLLSPSVAGRASDWTILGDDDQAVFPVPRRDPYLGAASVLRANGSTGDALRQALRGHALAEQAVRVRPGDLSAARTLLSISQQAGQLLRKRGRRDEARRLCEQYIGFGQDKVREHPRDVELRMDLAFLEGFLGELDQFEGRRLKAPHAPSQYRR
jgi:hypothetical protein